MQYAPQPKQAFIISRSEEPQPVLIPRLEQHPIHLFKMIICFEKKKGTHWCTLENIMLLSCCTPFLKAWTLDFSIIFKKKIFDLNRKIILLEMRVIIPDENTFTVLQCCSVQENFVLKVMIFVMIFVPRNLSLPNRRNVLKTCHVYRFVTKCRSSIPQVDSQVSERLVVICDLSRLKVL